MGCADAVCSQYVRPDRVALTFQVCRYSIEPIESNRLCNLLAKDALRSMLSDEPEENRPEVSFIFRPSLLAGGAEGLAGQRGCPNRSISTPSGEVEGVRPSGDACEEVVLGVSVEFMWLDVGDAAVIDGAWCYLARRGEFPEPRCGLGLEFIVVIHAATVACGVYPVNR